MKIHFFTKGTYKLSDSRHRAIKIAEEFNARGIDSVVHTPSTIQISETHWPKKALLIIKLIRSLTTVKADDIIFLQRTIGNKYFFIIMVAYLKIFHRKMIFDYDDAIYMHDFLKTKVFTQMADAVIVCGEDLKSWAGQYNSNVHVMHTTVKLADYEPYTKDYSNKVSPVVIGWVGTAKDHYHNLSLLAEVFQKLVGQTNIPFKFLLVGVWGFPKIKELFEPIKGLDVEFVDYVEPSKMAETIQGFDIGVNPLVGKTEWNMARSSFKPYEYMACGVANITSAVSEIINVIKDGENGLVADSVDEWVHKLKLLVEDRQLCADLGRRGQEVMRNRESYEAIMPRYISIICDIMEKK